MVLGTRRKGKHSNIQAKDKDMDMVKLTPPSPTPHFSSQDGKELYPEFLTEDGIS